jgi:hypothetical protein
MLLFFLSLLSPNPQSQTQNQYENELDFLPKKSYFYGSDILYFFHYSKPYENRLVGSKC